MTRDETAAIGWTDRLRGALAGWRRHKKPTGTIWTGPSENAALSENRCCGFRRAPLGHSVEVVFDGVLRRLPLLGAALRISPVSIGGGTGHEA